MGQEIERKFLLKNDTWRRLAQGILYRQGYICREFQRTVRVRVAEKKAWLTIKGPEQKGIRPEFEYAIPLEDAHMLLDTLVERPIIEKKRYRIPFAGFFWEVDEFLGENAGLIVAEVELEHPDQLITFPDWIGKEVTNDPRYYNSSLVRHPYSCW